MYDEVTKILDIVGNPTHCGKRMELWCAHLITQHGLSRHGLKVELVCSYCGELVHKIVHVTTTAEVRNILDGDEFWNDEISFAEPYVEETTTRSAEEAAGSDKMYYCTECKHNHMVSSDIGKDHVEYAEEE